MSDELNPCLACNSSDHLGTEEYGDDPDVGFTRKRISCECGVSGPWYNGPLFSGHVAAWNALPRAPRWVEYDGTEATLPEEEKEVIIISEYDTTGGCRVGQSWFDFQHEKWADIQVGHKWMFWPEGSE